MKKTWRQLSEYIAFEFWHEPLVIMAGILEHEQLEELLEKLNSNHQLLAYVLGNIDKPDVEKKFLTQMADNFIKKTSLIRYTQKAFQREADDIIHLAEVEGLGAHAGSIKVRL